MSTFLVWLCPVLELAVAVICALAAFWLPFAFARGVFGVLALAALVAAVWMVKVNLSGR